MSKLFIAVIISLFFTGLASAQDKEIRKEVEAIYAKRQKAILDKDFARLKSDLTDDYREKSEDGTIRNRQQADAELNRLYSIIKEVVAYSIKVVTIKEDNNIQIIVETTDSGEFNYVGPDGKTERLSGKGRQRDIWIRTHGELKIKYHEDLESTVQAVTNFDATLGQNTPKNRMEIYRLLR
jgi:hypothetical protein